MASRKQSTSVGKSGYALAQKRTDAEWEALVQKVYVPALKSGATMQSLREQYGRSTPARQAMIRLGLGTPADIAAGRKPSRVAGSIKVRGAKKAVAAKVAARRQAGVGWHALTLETGLAKDELTALLKAHGHTAVTSGRVLVSQKAIAKAAQVKPARKARKSKAAA